MYAEPFSLSTTTTVKAIAVDGDKTSEVAEATYTFAEATVINSIPDFKAVDDNTVIKFTGELWCVAQSGPNLFVRDYDGNYALFYGNIDVKLLKGQMIGTGFIGTKTTYNGEPELKVDAQSGIKGITHTLEWPEEVIQTSDVSAPKFGHLVTLKGVTISDVNGRNFTVTDNVGTAPGYMSMAVTSLPDASELSANKYDIVAVVGSYRSKSATETTYQLLPMQVVEATTGVDAVNANKTVAGVKFYNTSGVESTRIFDGVNIVVTTYTDGSKSVAKIVK